MVLTHMEYILPIGRLFEKMLFQKFGDFYVHDQNRLNSRKTRTFLKLKSIGTEHRHGDFNRELSDVVLTHIEYMLGIGKLKKNVFQKFCGFYVHDPNLDLNSIKMITFLKCSKKSGQNTFI